MNAGMATTRIPPCSALAVELGTGDDLVIIDPEGQQVSDLVAFACLDDKEYLSSGRSLDYAGHLWLTTGDVLYSNRSRPMFTILEDTCGRHDFTLTPCSKDTFRIIYGEESERPGCEGNLATELSSFGIGVDRIPVAFNVFMHVEIDASTGQFRVLPPLSKPGDFIRLRAAMPLVVAMSACSAGQSNNFSFKPIDFEVVRCQERRDEERIGAESGSRVPRHVCQTSEP